MSLIAFAFTNRTHLVLFLGAKFLAKILAHYYSNGPDFITVGGGFSLWATQEYQVPLNDRNLLLPWSGSHFNN